MTFPLRRKDARRTHLVHAEPRSFQAVMQVKGQVKVDRGKVYFNKATEIAENMGPILSINNSLPPRGKIQRYNCAAYFQRV